MYKHNYNWFVNSNINQKLGGYINNNDKINILEIGCFEGLSSVFFDNKFLDNNLSTLTLIDPFSTIADNDHMKYNLLEAEKNFDYNLSICKNRNKVTVHKITSNKFFEEYQNKMKYHFIYIDGSHEPSQIKIDMDNSFKVLIDNGIMWMDDYLGGNNGNTEIKETMDDWIRNNNCKIIFQGYQIAIRKNSR